MREPFPKDFFCFLPPTSRGVSDVAQLNIFSVPWFLVSERECVVQSSFFGCCNEPELIPQRAAPLPLPVTPPASTTELSPTPPSTSEPHAK